MQKNISFTFLLCCDQVIQAFWHNHSQHSIWYWRNFALILKLPESLPLKLREFALSKSFFCNFHSNSKDTRKQIPMSKLKSMYTYQSICFVTNQFSQKSHISWLHNHCKLSRYFSSAYPFLSCVHSTKILYFNKKSLKHTLLHVCNSRYLNWCSVFVKKLRFIKAEFFNSSVLRVHNSIQSFWMCPSSLKN